MRNLEAAGTGELRVGRRVEAFRAVAVADADKVDILRDYLHHWKMEVGVFFDGVGPDAPDAEHRRHRPRLPRLPGRAVTTSGRTSAADLSSRRPRYAGWRTRPLSVHSVKRTCATSTGCT